ncbi:chorismate-binding protein, partial [Actinomyces sp. oral taxon 171]|uniref:chorismate-binding protein n=1 Tax=Actinomyces sp. oral taxon 171 TaxID=706438 RepID=UPI001E591526
ALGVITFSPASQQSSVLVVPEVVVGCDGSGTWLTTVVPVAADGAEPEHPDPEIRLGAMVAEARTVIGREQSGDDGDSGGTTTVEAGALSEEQWCRAVSATQERMRAGRARKVVLARDVLAYPGAPLATGTVLRRLARDYPSTWVFAVDQMVGASPELLMRLRDRRLISRVLAGTARRHAGGAAARPAARRGPR